MTESPHTPPTPETPHDQTMHPLEAQRRANREAAVSAGLNPYGVRVEDRKSVV